MQRQREVAELDEQVAPEGGGLGAERGGVGGGGRGGRAGGGREGGGEEDLVPAEVEELTGEVSGEGAEGDQ